MYTDMQEWGSIRRRVLVDKVSKRQILDETGMHWQTLEKILAHPLPPGYRRSKPPDKPNGKLSKGLNVTLWVVSLVIAFFFIPYVNIFPSGYHYDTIPDFGKPLMFGAFAALAIRVGVGALFGERFFDQN